MSRMERIRFGKGHDAAEGSEQRVFVASGEVGAAPAVLKERIPGEKMAFDQETGTAGGMAGGMEHFHGKAGQGQFVA